MYLMHGGDTLNPVDGVREPLSRTALCSGTDLLFYIHTADAFFMLQTRGDFSPSILKVFAQQQSGELIK